MTEKREEKGLPIVNLTAEEREEVWDEIYLKEEGVVVEFDPVSNTGKVKSLSDDAIYVIDGRELLRTKIQLKPGGKVLFAPIEDADGTDYARIVNIIEISC